MRLRADDSLVPTAVDEMIRSAYMHTLFAGGRKHLPIRDGVR